MMRPVSVAIAVLLLPAAAFGVGIMPDQPAETRDDEPDKGSPRFSTPADIAAAARAGARSMGSTSLLHRRLKDNPGDHLGPGAFCLKCPMDEALLQALPRPKGIEGLSEADLQPLFDIPIVLNDQVYDVIRFFSEGNGRPHFQRYLNRSFRWIPLMHEILDEYGLPRDLVFVAMIESGFSMHAYSHAHAVGPWQFIAPTAKIYDLRMDAWVDERRDPVKATHAAARFMTWLYREFEDWNLAWAGYNGGPTRVRRNMDRTGIEDYWGLCEAGRLPRETCGYVPKIIAAAIISKLPERFGFEMDPLSPFRHEETTIDAAIDLSAIAGLLDVEVDELRGLNPELRRPMVPPPTRGNAGYRLRLPPGTKETFLARKDELEPSSFVAHESHTVRAGDSLWRIARAHGTTVPKLIAANPSLDPQRLMPGVEVLVPLPEGARPKVPSTREVPEKPRGEVVARQGGKVEVHHTVRAGDTLWSIAQRHGATTEQLLSWNRLASSGQHVHLSVGQRLIVGHGQGKPAVVSGDKPVHVLQAGETLWQLSQRYGQSVDELLALNEIDDVHSLSVGQVIIVGQ